MLPLDGDANATLTLKSAARTRALGSHLGRAALPGDLLLLTGPLGSGKTALTQGIALGLGLTQTINSPTFTILKEHLGGRLPLYHFDLYRIDDPEEIWQLGFEGYFRGAGLCVVEWAERAPDAWPGPWLWASLQVTSATSRQMTLCARGERGVALLHAAMEG